jgi:signal peptidase I
VFLKPNTHTQLIHHRAQMNITFGKKKKASPYGTPAQGPEGAAAQKKKKSKLREWFDSLLFAAIAALIIRTFFIEAFMIPTSSMERTLMVGDFLFVSKLHYGTRLPMVPLAFPFVHNRMPNTGGKSFVDWIVFPYARIPGFTDVERGDIVVFNYPADDIYCNDLMGDAPGGLGPITVPSMKENYIKRCVAQAGDLFEIRNGDVYINNQLQEAPPEACFRYYVRMKPGSILTDAFLAEYGFRPVGAPNGNWGRYPDMPPNTYFLDMPASLVPTFQAFPSVDSVYRFTYPREYFDNTRLWVPGTTNRFEHGAIHFPSDTSRYRFNPDHFGPVTIPAKGATVQLSLENIGWYERIIGAYEGHDLQVDWSSGVIKIDGQPASSYTFEMDYYFMMGDNRYNSLDSRFWGFVPMDHIVGTPIFVLFNREPGYGMRWNRWFHGAN